MAPFDHAMTDPLRTALAHDQHHAYWCAVPECGHYVRKHLAAAIAATPPTLDVERMARALHVANPIGSVAHIAAGVADPGGYLDSWDEEHIARHRAEAAAIAAAYAADAAPREEEG